MGTRKPATGSRPARTRIRAERQARGWTLEDLAERVGVTRQTIQRWETSGRDVNIEKLNAVASAFGIPVRALLPGDDGLTLDERALLEWHRGAGPQERRAVRNMIEGFAEVRRESVTARAG